MFTHAKAPVVRVVDRMMGEIPLRIYTPDDTPSSRRGFIAGSPDSHDGGARELSSTQSSTRPAPRIGHRKRRGLPAHHCVDEVDVVAPT
jgi:hypothetical protein